MNPAPITPKPEHGYRDRGFFSVAMTPDSAMAAADIGGTNTRVALAEGRKILPNTIRKYRNADYPGLESVLKEYIR